MCALSIANSIFTDCPIDPVDFGLYYFEKIYFVFYYMTTIYTLTVLRIIMLVTTLTTLHDLTIYSYSVHMAVETCQYMKAMG